jgi:hypothetical protein
MGNLSAECDERQRGRKQTRAAHGEKEDPPFIAGRKKAQAGGKRKKPLG